jgi:antitoxin ParD1/3/4
MATMNVSLPAKMKEWVEEQAATGRFANASDYVRDLIREDQERAKAIAEIQLLIDEGIESGISDMTVEDIRQKVRKELGITDTSDAA